MKRFVLFLFFFAYLASSRVSAKKPNIMPLENYTGAGKEAIGFSVFFGTEPEPFSVTLGYPLPWGGMTYIFARIHGQPASLRTPLEQSGAIPGMSGSPVFLHCKRYEECLASGILVGAISLRPIAFPLNDMNAAITPAALMFGATSSGFIATTSVTSAGPPPGMTYPMLISSSVDGATLAKFAADAPVISAGLSNTCAHASSVAVELKPGSMISVFLARGDRTIAASGTVTWRDENRIYAFGHPFFNEAMGTLSYPFAQTSVAQTLTSRFNPSKFMGCLTGVQGVITTDSVSEISGEIGRAITLISLHATVRTSKGTFTLEEDVVPNIPKFTEAILAQLPQAWAGQTIGWQTNVAFRYTLRVVPRGFPEIFIRNIGYDTSINGMPIIVPITLLNILGKLEKSGFAHSLQSVDMEVGLLPALSRWEKQEVRLSKKEALPGETLTLYIVLRKTPEGVPLQAIEVPITIPADILSRAKADASSGALYSWSCPMHPEIHAKEAGKCPTCGMALVASPSDAANKNAPLSDSAAIEILVQDGLQFTDKRQNHLAPRTFAKFIERLNGEFSGQADTIYIQEILPPKKGESAPVDTPTGTSRPLQAADMLKWKEFVDPVLSPTNTLPNDKPEVVLRTLPAITGTVSLNETVKITVKSPVKNKEPEEKITPQTKKEEMGNFFF